MSLTAPATSLVRRGKPKSSTPVAAGGVRPSVAAVAVVLAAARIPREAPREPRARLPLRYATASGGQVFRQCRTSVSSTVEIPVNRSIEKRLTARVNVETSHRFPRDGAKIGSARATALRPAAGGVEDTSFWRAQSFRIIACGFCRSSVRNRDRAPMFPPGAAQVAPGSRFR